MCQNPIRSVIFQSTLSNLASANLVAAVVNEDPTVIEGGGVLLSAQKVGPERVAGKTVQIGGSPVSSLLQTCQRMREFTSAFFFQTDPAFNLPDGIEKHLEELGSAVSITFSVYNGNLYSFAEPGQDR